MQIAGILAGEESTDLPALHVSSPAPASPPSATLTSCLISPTHFPFSALEGQGCLQTELHLEVTSKTEPSLSP